MSVIKDIVYRRWEYI